MKEMSFCGQRGSVLVMVLIITAIGLLFGAGALLLFRYQCQLRIERQHELEKVYAVRSALNYIRTYNGKNLIDTVFEYHTASERFLRLPVSPAKVIFPDPGNEKHLDMGSVNALRNFKAQLPNQYDADLDCEYGGTANEMIRTIVWKDLPFHGLEFYDQKTTNEIWWVNVGMLGTGGWLQQEYGRRYSFLPVNYVGDGESEKTRDIMRLCIIRNVTNKTNAVGHRYGWPLSKEGERALVLQIRPMAGYGNDPGAELLLSEYVYTGGRTNETPLILWNNRPSKGYKGLQIAGRIVSLFDISQAPIAYNLGNAYTFSPTNMMTKATYDYFAEGRILSDDGRILKAPELRAVFEVEACSTKRPVDDAIGGDTLTNFRVTPAYQYDVFLEHPLGTEPKPATVAQRIGEYSPKDNESWFSVLTYDTHGTENKGFRKDEREAERKRDSR